MKNEKKRENSFTRTQLCNASSTESLVNTLRVYRNRESSLYYVIGKILDRVLIMKHISKGITVVLFNIINLMGPFLVVLMILSWNVRGAGAKTLPLLIRDMVAYYKMSILGLVEPRISGEKADRVIKRLPFTHNHIVHAKGFS